MSTTIPSLPSRPGTYVLILHLPGQRLLQVGKLGQFEFPAGHYAYVGSAFGPGGLAGRLKRHTRPPAGPDLHWHIDYLRRWAMVAQIWYTEHESKREHAWAELLQRLPGATIPAQRFGASDCRCQSHLFHFQTKPNRVAFQQLLMERFPGDVAIQTLDYAALNELSK